MQHEDIRLLDVNSAMLAHNVNLISHIISSLTRTLFREIVKSVSTDLGSFDTRRNVKTSGTWDVDVGRGKKPSI